MHHTDDDKLHILCVNIQRGNIQWLRWSCEAGGSPDEAGWSKPHTHSTPN